MSFEQFLAYVRERIDKYCSDSYWKKQYDLLKDKTIEGVKKEEPFLAIHAVAEYYGSTNKVLKR